MKAEVPRSTDSQEFNRSSQKRPQVHQEQPKAATSSTGAAKSGHKFIRSSRKRPRVHQEQPKVATSSSGAAKSGHEFIRSRQGHQPASPGRTAPGRSPPPPPPLAEAGGHGGGGRAGGGFAAGASYPSSLTMPLLIPWSLSSSSSSLSSS